MVRRTTLLILSLSWACHGSGAQAPWPRDARADPPGGDARIDGTPDAGEALSDAQVSGPVTQPDARVAQPADGGDDLPPAAPFSEPIRYAARPGSVVVYVPEVSGAEDYRIFALEPGVTVDVNADGTERVEGAVIACAGLVQHNQCDRGEALTSYGPNFRVADCAEDPRAVHVQKRVARSIQVDGLREKTRLVVEAIDGLCSFPGAYGAQHADIECFADGRTTRTATYEGATVDWRVCPVSVPVRAEAEIRRDYASLILNGQGPAPATAAGSPWATTGLPAPARAPKVLARAVVEVEPRTPTELPPGFAATDFYESFSDPNDQPQKVAVSDLVPADFPVQNSALWQTSRLNLYSFAAESPQWFVAQGTMRSVLPDWAQNIMASNVMLPRRAFALPESDGRYVHVTFEVPTNATQRRYWWFYACGAAQPGATLQQERLAPRAGIVPRPGFMNPLEGFPISTQGWNCLQIVPRNGSYASVPGGPYHSASGPGRAESDLRIVLNRASAPATGDTPPSGVVLNVSPSMDGEDPDLYGSWLRQWDAAKNIVGVLLDDALYVEQRVTFDVYFNRGRIVLFADGVQKLCNGYSAHRLTMAEAAIGVGHVLYHSSAEREDIMREDWLTTGQSHYLHNLSMLDQRSFDNFGVREGAALPAHFEEGQCYDRAR